MYERKENITQTVLNVQEHVLFLLSEKYAYKSG